MPFFTFLPPRPVWCRAQHCPNVQPDASRGAKGAREMARLSGRTAIVTGGAVGIGRHYSQALAAEGAQVMIADIKDGAGLAAETAAKHGRNSTASFQFDVSDEAQCKALVARTIERFGKIDILINNAALYAPLPTLKVTEMDVAPREKV